MGTLHFAFYAPDKELGLFPNGHLWVIKHFKTYFEKHHLNIYETAEDFRKLWLRILTYSFYYEIFQTQKLWRPRMHPPASSGKVKTINRTEGSRPPLRNRNLCLAQRKSALFLAYLISMLIWNLYYLCISTILFMLFCVFWDPSGIPQAAFNFLLENVEDSYIYR